MHKGVSGREVIITCEAPFVRERGQAGFVYLPPAEPQCCSMWLVWRHPAFRLWIIVECIAQQRKLIYSKSKVKKNATLGEE
jgi:hypothetical protein